MTQETASPAPAFREPPHTLGTAIRQIGPGLILAGAIVGTGELIATTHLGAKAGFVLLWLVIVSCFIKVFVQVELGRYAISSGEGTFASFRRLPGPGILLVWWCAIMLLSTQAQIGAMIGGIGQAIHMVVPGVSTGLAWAGGGLNSGVGEYLARRPELPWAILPTVLTAAMLASGSYRLIERVTTTLVVLFTVLTVVCVALLPAAHAIRWENLAEGFTFRIPSREVLAAAFTMVGITGVGATELLTYPYWCIEKGYARYVGLRNLPTPDQWLARARGWIKVMQLDAWFSMVIYTISTLAFYLLGAAVLHDSTQGEGLPGTVEGLLTELARMYEPVLGAWGSRWFVVLGAFSVLFSTLFAATAGASRLFTDFLRVNRFIDPERDDLRLLSIRAFSIGLPLLGFVLFVGIQNPILMIMIGGIMQGISLPLIAAGAVFLRYKRTDPRIRPRFFWDIFLWVSMFGLFLAAAYTLWDTVDDLLLTAE